MTKTQSEFVYTFNDETTKDNDRLVYRDKKIFNRFWFEYPPEWRTANVKERYIGFRSLYVSKIYRHLVFDLEITMSDENHINDNVFTVQIHNRIRYDEHLYTLYNDLRSRVKEYIELHKEEWKDVPIPDWNKVRTDRCFLTENGQKLFCNKIYYDDEDADVKFAILNPNDDAKAVLNIDDDGVSRQRTIIFRNVWDRYSILLRSNISVNISKNYLGFTNKNYNPIKYYKINSQDTKFYIDLYHGHYQNIPVNLPNDEKEQIILEIVIPED